MTDYIEEMMRTAGVEYSTKRTKDCEVCVYYEEHYDAPVCDCRLDKCRYEVKTKPIFTPEKQLEIIKLICISDYEFTVDIEEGKTIMFATPVFWSCKQIQAENQNFSQALAQLTTELVKAGELTKEKVKEILKG